MTCKNAMARPSLGNKIRLSYRRCRTLSLSNSSGTASGTGSRQPYEYFLAGIAASILLLLLALRLSGVSAVGESVPVYFRNLFAKLFSAF